MHDTDDVACFMENLLCLLYHNLLSIHSCDCIYLTARIVHHSFLRVPASICLRLLTLSPKAWQIGNFRIRKLVRHSLQLYMEGPS